jgi:hypothetical protein
MKAKVLPLLGEYNREGSRLGKVDGGRMIISRRKANPTTPNKTENFLLYVHPDGKRSYVSSLWQTSSTDVFSFEYAGVRYQLNCTKQARATVTRQTDSL